MWNKFWNDEAGAIISPPWAVSSILETTALGYVYESLADNAWYDANCAGRGLLPERGATGERGTPVTTDEIGRTEPESGVSIGSDPVTVGVTPEGAVFIDETPVAEADLVAQLTARGVNGTEDRIFLRGDTSANYGAVMRVMGLLSAGVDLRNGQRDMHLVRAQERFNAQPAMLR